MRIWLDPIKMANLQITVGDVTSAVTAQNAQVSAGQIGGLPTVKGQRLNAIVNVQSRLQTPEQFRQILLRTNPDGSTVRLGDVARVEIGAETEAYISRYNGHPATGLAIKLAPGANALATIKAVKAKMDELSADLPARHQGGLSDRHLALHQPLDQGRRGHPVRGGRAWSSW